MARSHDGPGFRDVDSHIDALIPILKKVSSTVPESSIVGAFLGFRRNSKIIRSRAFFLFQHNPFSWIISPKRGDFVYLKYRKKKSLRSEVASIRWIQSLAVEEKAHMIDLIFLILDPARSAKIDFSHHKIRQIRMFVARYKALGEKDRLFVRSCLKKLFVTYKGLRIDRFKYQKITIYDESVKSR